jgi:hypothetical protein
MTRSSSNAPPPLSTVHSHTHTHTHIHTHTHTHARARDRAHLHLRVRHPAALKVLRERGRVEQRRHLAIHGGRLAREARERGRALLVHDSLVVHTLLFACMCVCVCMRACQQVCFMPLQTWHGRTMPAHVHLSVPKRSPPCSTRTPPPRHGHRSHLCLCEHELLHHAQALG